MKTREACAEQVRLQFCDLRTDIEMRFGTDTPPPFKKVDADPVVGESHVHRAAISTHRQISLSDILLWLLQLPIDSPHRESIKRTGNLVGRISWRFSSSATVLQHTWSTKSVKSSMTISIHLPIVRRAFTLECEKALGQWTHTFRMIRIVPDNSPVFKLCATEDQSGVLTLFESGQASPFDQTTSGITLLHVSKSPLLTIRYQQKPRLRLRDIVAKSTSSSKIPVSSMASSTTHNMANCKY